MNIRFVIVHIIKTNNETKWNIIMFCVLFCCIVRLQRYNVIVYVIIWCRSLLYSSFVFNNFALYLVKLFCNVILLFLMS